jgi:hypothetical protein
MWHAWERREVFTGFWLGGPKAKYHWEDMAIGGLREIGRTGFCWLRKGSGGGLL